MSEERGTLSEREMDILRLVATGATNQQVARALSISVNTVKVHLNRIFTKLGVESRTEAALYAVREGWVVVGAIPSLEGVSEAPAGAEEMAIEAPPQRISLARRIFFVVAALSVLGVTFFPRGAISRSAHQPVSAFTDRRSKLISSGSSFEVYRWTSRARMPTPRGRLALVAYDNALYAIGGDTADGVTEAVEVYYPDDNRWVIKMAKPTAVSNIGGTVIKGRIYVPGGTTAGGKVTRVMEVYDVAEDSWEEKAPLPVPLCAYAIAAVGDKLYLFGGWDGQRYVSTVYEYDPEKDLWAIKTAMPTAKGFAGAGVIEGKVYIVGGYNEAQEFATCEEYNPARDNGVDDPWTVKSPLAMGRGGLGVAAVGHNLYAIGGGWENYLAFNERYDPRTDMWLSFETPLVVQWRNLGVAATETKICAVGGWNEGYLSVNEEYQALFRLFLPIGPGK